MNKNVWIATLAMAVSGAATAAAPAHPDSTETGTYYHGAEYQRVNGKFARSDTWAIPTTAPAFNVVVLESGDGWRFVGGEPGWELEQHSYAIVRGRLVHNDRFPHDTPKPLGMQRPLDIGSGG